MFYDPACGTGGMLLETVLHVKENGGNPKELRIKGQETNLTTESYCSYESVFLHGQEDFTILRGDTLRHPKFISNDQLETFDNVIANPPFSLSEWGHETWKSDPYNRNTFGLPPKKKR